MTRILVVEDSRTQAEAARVILEDAGYEVVVARNGREALERVREQSFDLIVSDIVMPLMTGYELCREIKSDPVTRSLPVILLTTLSDPMDIIQGLETGADNFVTKPYDPAYLIERVGKVLENKALRVGKSKVSVEIMFLGKKFSISSDKEQILDLLIATFEDMVRTNRSLQNTQAELSAAKTKIEEYARALEGQVRRSEEKYRTLMDQAPDAIMVLDRNGIVIERNERVPELLGHEDGLGKTIDVVLPGEIAEGFRYFLEHGTSSEGSGVISRPDGTSRRVEYALSTTQVGDERLIVAVIRDVTEQKKLERDFNEAQKFAAVARLASGAAHDFNNVLMAILTFADLLRRQVPDDHPVRRSADQIGKAARRGSWLTGQLLAFTRGRSAVDELTDVNAVIRNTREMLQQLAGERIEVQFDLHQGSSLIAVEVGRVEQVILNLVVNARDAMPDGGRIRVETRNVNVRDNEALGAPVVQGNYVVLTVDDSGSGMTPEIMEKIFEPLFTTKAPGRGTGLGLDIVRLIVNDAHGYIGVRSAPGEGASFSIFIPRVDSFMEAQESAPAPVISHQRGTERILLVHADASIRSLMCEVLIIHGYSVHAVSNRSEAEALIEERRAALDLVVLCGEAGAAGETSLPNPVDLRVVTIASEDGHNSTVTANDLLSAIRATLDEAGRDSA